MSLYIQKYGGTSVGTLERIKHMAEHIAATYKQGHRLVVVVSAMGQQTDELLEMAMKLSPHPPQREVDMLLSVGERITMSLLSIALNNLAIPTISLTGSQSGILTDNTFGNARINRILGDRIRRALEDNKLVIVAGFQGMSEVEKEITTLGRGGSDLTAIALTHVLKADRCQIYKDVDGICTADPRLVAKAYVLQTMSWDTLSALTWCGSGVVHNRGVHLAKKFKIPLEIRSSFNLDARGTRVGSGEKMEKAVVHALTHKNDLSWVELNGPESDTLSAELIRELMRNGEHPFYLQERDAKTEIICSTSVLAKVAKHLEKSHPAAKLKIIRQNLTCISAIGDGYWQQPELITLAVRALQKVPVLVDCKNSVLNMFVDQGNLEDLLVRLHEALIEQKA